MADWTDNRRSPRSTSSPPTAAHRRRAGTRLELVGQAELGLRAIVVEPAEAPRLEDGRAVAVGRDEVALGEVDDEVITHDVIDGPERLHVPLVHPVDRCPNHRHDAAAAVEGESREREDALPVADLVAVR